MKKIKLNNEIGIDIDKLVQSRMVILANSGAGKSYAIRKIAEEAVNQIQTIIIDPEGEFSSLREKFDFILCGKGADVAAEPRSAALLATKLLELGKSAVIDLYELHPQERQRFVKLFCDAMVNAPKELYHPCLVILDEAHEFVPEGKPSEATWSVELLASKGRKRGFCLIPASQRISKLSKNVSAECNNKLIGRASQDIDMKRAGDELGFTKENLVQLRQLQPGEFFAFGPAISMDVQKIKIGEVKTEHAKVGYNGSQKTPPPSDVIKKALGELNDLPAEAERELKTNDELRSALTVANKKIRDLEKAPKVVHDMTVPTRMIDEAVEKKEKEWIKKYNDLGLRLVKDINRYGGAMQKAFDILKPFIDDGVTLWSAVGYQKIVPEGSSTVNVYKGSYNHIPKDLPKDAHIPHVYIPTVKEKEDMGRIVDGLENAALARGEHIVLSAIAQFPDGMSSDHLAVLTGYKKTSRLTYTQKLAQKGYIERNANGDFVATKAAIDALGDTFTALPTGQDLVDYYMTTLPQGEKALLGVFIEHPGDFFTTGQLMELTNYKKTSVLTYGQKLVAKKILLKSGNHYSFNSKVFE